MQLVPRPGRPDFLDLPWDQPLVEWEPERLAVVERGIGRHVVRFVEYGTSTGFCARSSATGCRRSSPWASPGGRSRWRMS